MEWMYRAGLARSLPPRRPRRPAMAASRLRRNSDRVYGLPLGESREPPLSAGCVSEQCTRRGIVFEQDHDREGGWGAMECTRSALSVPGAVSASVARRAIGVRKGLRDYLP